MKKLDIKFFLLKANSRKIVFQVKFNIKNPKKYKKER